MTTLNLVRPELRRFLSDYPVSVMTDEALRRLRANPLPVPEVAATPGLAVTEAHVPGPDGAPPVRVLIYQPTAVPAPRPAILHMHGGGYVVGSPEMSDAANHALAAGLGCVIVSVDYRLPPETPFPGPLEDCYAALKWTYDHAGELGVDPARLAVKGESAGGGLAAGLALLARDQAEVPVAFQCLTYPMIDDRPAAEPHPFTGEFIWTPESNRFGWSAYLGHEPGGDGVSPYAAAARADDLIALPPAWIAAASLDLFLEEDLDYARRLIRAGVPTDVRVYSGAYHGFPMAGDTEIYRGYVRDCMEALAAGLSA